MLTKEEIKKYKEEIETMTHIQMAYLYRFAPQGHPIFNTEYDIYQNFHKRFFDHFDGMTPEISKQIGWDK